jgi:hypothetical protein
MKPARVRALLLILVLASMAIVTATSMSFALTPTRYSHVHEALVQFRAVVSETGSAEPTGKSTRQELWVDRISEYGSHDDNERYRRDAE